LTLHRGDIYKATKLILTDYKTIRIKWKNFPKYHKKYNNLYATDSPKHTQKLIEIIHIQLMHLFLERKETI
ncbi:hypothetical protein, partial [Bacteroides fluxus]|uniref:hypothetical protein n=1 Tax=Bacteroides fluxus TaxID=626930 RepID=UPI0023F1A54F